MIEYVRVTVRGIPRPKVFWAKVERRGRGFNVYVPVNRHGNSLSRHVKAGDVLPMKVVAKSTILREVSCRINEDCGTLEVIGR